MNAIKYTLLGSLVLGAALMFVAPAPAQGDDYWDGYWGWYDNTYRPYQYRQYARTYTPSASYYAPGPGYAYGNTYYGYPGYSYAAPYYGGYHAGPVYGGAYYGTPNVGYRDFGGYGGQVRVGPVRYGWR